MIEESSVRPGVTSSSVGHEIELPSAAGVD
jgi:hypothetical protein